MDSSLSEHHTTAQKVNLSSPNSFDAKKMDLFRYMQVCSHFLLILITLLKDVHTTILRKTCSGFRRNPAFDNLALNTSTFRIQVRNEIQHPMCIQRCFQHGSDCAGVLVNENLQLCWFLKCFLTERFLQRGLLTVSSGWKYYLEDNSRWIKITFRCLETHDLFNKSGW